MELDLVYYVLAAYGILELFALILYVPKIIQFFSAFYRPAHRIAEQKRKISLVIPARNESGAIPDLFVSIANQTYGKEFFDVNVIVDRADDPTVKLAEEAGAKVFVVTDQRCKGDALDGFFKQLGGDVFKATDAFVIVDADAVLTDRYVEELNNALEYDCQIFLSRKSIKNYLGGKESRTVFTNCSVLTYPQLDDLCNNYRTKHNIPMNMCGQGMMIRREVIEEIGGWPYRTLTEDYELRMDCFLRGFTSMYYPYAILYTEEVLTHRESYARRLRWVTGFSQCNRLYKNKIRKQVKERGSLTEGEFEFFFFMFPIMLFVAVTALTWLAGIGLIAYYAVIGEPYWLHAMLLLLFLPLFIMYIFLLFYSMLCMVAYRDVFKPLPMRERFLTLLVAPLFCMEYLPIFFASRKLAKTGMEWTPTARVKYSGGVAEVAEALPDSSTDGEQTGLNGGKE